MKKILFFISCLFSLVTFAQDKIASYTMSFFEGRVFDIAAGEPKDNGDFSFYIYVAGEHTNESVCLSIDNKQVPAFINALEIMKEKFPEWKETAIKNNVSDIKKEFPVTFPKMTVAWYGTKWWFAFNKTFTPQFFVFKDGSCAAVTTAKVKSSSNEYIDQTFYLVFEDASEIDTLIKGLDSSAVVKHYSSKNNAADLFN